jgi:DtxR family Mn-dependent transcriptional regulator
MWIEERRLHRTGSWRMMPSATLEEYLELIYKFSLDGVVRPVQLAEALAVSAPTVTSSLRRLEAAGLVTRPGLGVELTESGRREALAIVRRHRVAERFLVDALGLPWDVAHEEACVLEHALSERVLAALEVFLDNPDVCPHGHPIPSAALDVAPNVGLPLSEMPAGSSATVVSVPEDDEEVLAYFGEIAMRPGVGLFVEETAPFAGPLLVIVGDKRVPVDRTVAARILVRPES